MDNLQTLTPTEAVAAMSDMFGEMVKLIAVADDGIMTSARGVLTHGIHFEDDALGAMAMNMFNLEMSGESDPVTFGFFKESIQHAYVENNTLRIETGCGFLQIVRLPSRD